MQVCRLAVYVHAALSVGIDGGTREKVKKRSSSGASVADRSGLSCPDDMETGPDKSSWRTMKTVYATFPRVE